MHSLPHTVWANGRYIRGLDKNINLKKNNIDFLEILSKEYSRNKNHTVGINHLRFEITIQHSVLMFLCIFQQSKLPPLVIV